MNITTQALLTTVANSDPTLTHEERTAIEGLVSGRPARRSSLESILISQKEAARLLNVSRVTLWRLTGEGVFSTVEVTPGTKRYRRDDIESFAQRGIGQCPKRLSAT